MEGTNDFKKTIEDYLKNKASKDPQFKARFELKKKNIEDCIKYILNTVKKSGCNGFADAEIFGMALHYYDEDKIDVGKDISASAVVNHVTDNKHAKAYRINADEIKFISERLKNEPKKEMQDNSKLDIKNLRDSPKKYWDEFALKTFSKETEAYSKISFMQDHYKKKTTIKAKPSNKKPQQEAKKVEPKKEVIKQPIMKVIVNKETQQTALF